MNRRFGSCKTSWIIAASATAAVTLVVWNGRAQEAAPAAAPRTGVVLETEALARKVVPGSEQEKAIQSALDRLASFDFNEVSLAEVLEFVRSFASVNIVTVENQIESAGVSLDVPITLSANDVPLRSALKLILEPLGLTYTVRDDVLQIVSRSDDRLRTRVYPVADLVLISSNGQVVISSKPLIESITETIRRDSWQERGGNGSIVFHPATLSLVVSQSDAVQDEVTGLLSQLRRASGLLSEICPVTNPGKCIIDSLSTTSAADSSLAQTRPATR